MTLPAGSPAPDFAARDALGREVRLSELRGRWILVYFYPRDFTPGCTVEACTLNDSLSDFEDLGATVIGVSSQGESSHRRFQEEHGLRFDLAADPEPAIGDAYDVPVRGVATRTSARTSFLIDPHGIVARVWDTVKPATHANQVLKAIQAAGDA